MLAASEESLRERIETLEEENRQLREMLLPSSEFVDLRLTATERAILAAIYKRPGQIFSRERLVELLDYDKEAKNFDVFMSRIRRKLPAGIPITTVWGIGWTMNREAAALLKPFE